MDSFFSPPISIFSFSVGRTDELKSQRCWTHLRANVLRLLWRLYCAIPSSSPIVQCSLPFPCYLITRCGLVAAVKWDLGTFSSLISKQKNVTCCCWENLVTYFVSIPLWKSSRVSMIKIVCHYFSFQIDHALFLASIISVDLPAMNAWMSAEGLRFVIIKRSFASFCQLVINNAWQRNGELGAVELHFGCFVPGDLRQSSYSTRLRTLCPATRRQLLRQTHPSPARHRWLLVAYLSKVKCVKAPSSIHVYAFGCKLFHA